MCQPRPLSLEGTDILLTMSQFLFVDSYENSQLSHSSQPLLWLPIFLYVLFLSLVFPVMLCAMMWCSPGVLARASAMLFGLCNCGLTMLLFLTNTALCTDTIMENEVIQFPFRKLHIYIFSPILKYFWFLPNYMCEGNFFPQNRYSHRRKDPHVDWFHTLRRKYTMFMCNLIQETQDYSVLGKLLD